MGRWGFLHRQAPKVLKSIPINLGLYLNVKLAGAIYRGSGENLSHRSKDHLRSQDLVADLSGDEELLHGHGVHPSEVLLHQSLAILPFTTTCTTSH